MKKNKAGAIIFVMLFFLAFCRAPGFSQGSSGALPDAEKDAPNYGGIDEKVLGLAVKGYEKARREFPGIKPVIAIADYSLPSTQKRFYVIDLENKKLLYLTLVAHGKNTGGNTAEYFSNEPKTLKSSPGFYLTLGTYNGENGYSLRLKGLEKGINDNAEKRSIVIHGAAYVSDDFIRSHGRIGRSWGCPALPLEQSREIMDLIKGGACVFLYADDTDYLSGSAYLNP